MLIQFSVKNFLSIKNKIIFSMLASCDNENEENIITVNNVKYLKTAVMYGANASGKSNFISAFGVVSRLIRQSSNMQPNMKLGIVPFEFNDKTKNEPSEFELIMIIEGIKYVYGFKADKSKVYEEYLYYYPNGRETEIFDRTEVNNYHFPRAEKGLESIKEKNTENKFLLATATTWNYEKTKPVYDYIANGIFTLFDYEPLKNASYMRYSNDSTGELKKFSLNLLNVTDINIVDYTISSVIMDEQQASTLPPPIRQLIPIGSKGYSVHTNHKIKDNNGNIVDKSLDFEEESLGTKNVFILSPLLFEVLKEGKTLVIDEFDRSLHPLLVRYIVELFNNSSINKNGAQLIFNTHDTNLLDLTLFRRDQIWFVEKNYYDGVTDIYPLDDFSVRKTENIQKGYLNGRYGAIPFIKAGDELWQGILN